MNKYLKRQYYENDNTFYTHKASISCWEQMEYQSLRDFDIDYFLVFCDDINIKYKKEECYVSTHDLNLNSEIFVYHCLTQNAKEAEKVIDEILQMGKIVIFRTASDFLRTSCWYHENEPYTHILHNAIIIGENNDFYFYVDSPPMRNKQYFISHPDNPVVGCIMRKELLESFSYACEIGYIEINEQKLGNIADIGTILKNIKKYFYYKSNDNVLVGKEALVNFMEYLGGGYNAEEVLSDPFPFNLIAARHKKLDICIDKYVSFFSDYKYIKLKKYLRQLIENWNIFEVLAIKYGISEKIICERKMSNLLKTKIIPLTEELIDII